jgi:hypothetical protein
VARAPAVEAGHSTSAGDKRAYSAIIRGVNNPQAFLAALAVATVLSGLAGYWWVTRRRGGASPSLRPPASTPALNKIELIKRYREQYGVSLAEATEAVEAQLVAESKRP